MYIHDIITKEEKKKERKKERHLSTNCIYIRIYIHKLIHIILKTTEIATEDLKATVAYMKI